MPCGSCPADRGGTEGPVAERSEQASETMAPRPMATRAPTRGGVRRLVINSPRVGALVANGLGAIVSLACSDRSATGPSVPPLSAGHDPQGIQAAIVAHGRHTTALLHIPGVVGTAVGLLPNGRAALRVFLAKRDVRGLP